MTPNPHFKGMPLFDVKCLRMVQDRHTVTYYIPLQWPLKASQLVISILVRPPGLSIRNRQSRLRLASVFRAGPFCKTCTLHCSNRPKLCSIQFQVASKPFKLQAWWTSIDYRVLSTHERMWPVDVIKLRQNPSLIVATNQSSPMCAVSTDPLNSAAILKIDKTSLSASGGPISMQFGRLMQNNMPITVIWLFLSFLNSSLLVQRRNTTSGFRLCDVIVFKRSKTITVYLCLSKEKLKQPLRRNNNVRNRHVITGRPARSATMLVLFLYASIGSFQVFFGRFRGKNNRVIRIFPQWGNFPTNFQ